mgnify:FL=1
MCSKTKFILISFCFIYYNSLCQNTFVPDANFEQALIDEGYDSGPLDGNVLTSNISGILNLDIKNRGITNLTGIEDFSALKNLDCSSNLLINIDVRPLSNLQILWCFENQITNLNVDQNISLTALRCENNKLTSLSLSNNINLVDLACEQNKITTIDVSNSVSLNRFQCGNNLLNTLDVSTNVNLSYLSCEQNQLTSLNLLSNNQLSLLNCFNNQITELDLTRNPNLTDVNCSTNQLCSLNLNNSSNSTITDINFDLNTNLNCVVVDNANGNHSNWVPASFSNYVESPDECRDFIPVDSLENVIGTSYTLPMLNNGNYFTETNGMGASLNSGDVITSTQTIYIFNETTCNSNESSFEVIINNNDYFIPKYFTPNNDGANDVWQVYDRLNLINNISIYNRHGKLLKFLPNNTSAWDGTFNGELLSSGSYWYEVVLNSREILRGYFALKR